MAQIQLSAAVREEVGQTVLLLAEGLVQGVENFLLNVAGNRPAFPAFLNLFVRQVLDRNRYQVAVGKTVPLHNGVERLFARGMALQGAPVPGAVFRVRVALMLKTVHTNYLVRSRVPVPAAVRITRPRLVM